MSHVAKSIQLEKAFESIFNIFFYIVLVCIVLASLGIDPLVLFASISGFVLGFAFMIGAACSKYFEVSQTFFGSNISNYC
jgi:small-conductance mechanosensitive channel